MLMMMTEGEDERERALDFTAAPVSIVIAHLLPE